MNKSLSQPTDRPSRLNYFMLALVGLVCIGGVIWLYTPASNPQQQRLNQPPLSEAALKATFLKNKRDLKILGDMFFRDNLLSVDCDSRAASLRASGSPDIETLPQQLPPGQIDAYRKLMRRIGVRMMYRFDVKDKVVKFEISDVDVKNGGISRGYEFGEMDSNDGQFVQALNTRYETFNAHDDWTEYIRLEQNWNLYQRFNSQNAPLGEG